MGVEQHVRQIRLVEVVPGHRGGQPAVVGCRASLRTRHVTVTGTPSAASSLTSGYIIFPADAPGTGRPRRGAAPRPPARAAGCGGAAHAARPTRQRHTGTVAVLDVGSVHPVAQARVGDAEVLRDLRDRGFPAAGDRHDVVAELLGVGSGHGAHPSSGDRVPTGQVSPIRAADPLFTSAGRVLPTSRLVTRSVVAAAPGPTSTMGERWQ